MKSSSNTAIITTTSKLATHPSTRSVRHSQKSLRKARDYWLEKIIKTLEQQVKQLLETQPEAQVIWLGGLDQIQNSPNWQHQYPRLVKQFEQIQEHPRVIALDFGWIDFATWMTAEGWGIIPNLHPSKSWQQHSSQLRQCLGRIGQWQKIVKELGSESQNQRMVVLQESITTALSQESQFKASVRQAMFTVLETVCQDSTMIVTETLDIQRLYRDPSKRRTLDDLDWWNLIAEVQQQTSKNQQELVLLRRNFKSLTCPNCGYCSLKNRVQSGFRCQKCQSQVHPDVVALLNLWREWLSKHSSRTTRPQSRAA